MDNLEEVPNVNLEDRNTDEYCKELISLVRSSQKFSSELQGWHHFSDYSGVYNTMNRINQAIYKLIANIFQHQDIKLDIRNLALKEKLEILKEGNDALLERINSDFDEARGIRRLGDNQIVDTNIHTIRSSNLETGREVVLLASRNVQKPQLFFSPEIDNSAEPFIPSIKEKPNSIKPLSVMLCCDENGREYYSHPYEYELQNWVIDEEFLKLSTVQKFKPIGQTSLKMVEDIASLKLLIETLKMCKEFAVDVENHSFRSYQGLTCLIQISTREEDFLVDPFPLRNELYQLNEVFTNPNITKVFHGADFDVLWLQRDCGIYIVNLFDTHQAAIVLEYPHRSLANLLLNFCSLSVNKSYQRADWRIRPLPDDFVEYARSDSHYLLYIYDLMRNELIEKGNEFNNLLRATYDRSTELCLKRYEKPILKVDSHLELYRRSKKFFNNRQLYALQQLYGWRDRIARQQDESVDYVLPKHMMMQMADVMPKEMQGILACCNPIPPLVKTEQLTLHQIIRDAREQHPDKIATNLFPLKDQNSLTVLEVSHADSHSSFICKHDLSAVEEDLKGLPTLINPQETLFGDMFVEDSFKLQLRKKSALFGLAEKIFRVGKYQKSGEPSDETLTPYERYLLMQSFLKAERDRENDTEERINGSTEFNITKKSPDMIEIARPKSRNAEVGVSEVQNSDRIARLQKHVHSVLHLGSSVSNYAEDNNASLPASTIDEECSNPISSTEELLEDHYDRISNLQMEIDSLVSSARKSCVPNSVKLKTDKRRKKKPKRPNKNSNNDNNERDVPPSAEPLFDPSGKRKRVPNENSSIDFQSDDEGVSDEPSSFEGDNFYSRANFDIFHRKRQRTHRRPWRRGGRTSRGFRGRHK